ncbi:hypothetical protein Y032_0458g1827 [Ancylostoma ceylanicum]|nr:hypothetical protein Y032_0458g1827 [Ancylostoma ceylanicum]
MALKVCDEHIALLETSLSKLASAFDDLEEHSKDDGEQLDKYMNSVQEEIVKLHAHKTQLQHMIRDCTNDREMEPREDGRTPSVVTQATPLSPSNLPVIPIPIFSGRRWEWENFCALFEANVHDQDLTELQKFNYLVSSLRDEAKEITRFQVTENNYERAMKGSPSETLRQ